MKTLSIPMFDPKMLSEKSEVIDRSEVGVALISCQNGNYQGEPDREGAPRIDDSGRALTTTQLPRRVLRNFWLSRGIPIYLPSNVNANDILNEVSMEVSGDKVKPSKEEKAAEKKRVDDELKARLAKVPEKDRKDEKAKILKEIRAKKVKSKTLDVEKLVECMRDRYLDFRLFGGSLAGVRQERGCMQGCMGFSPDPVVDMNLCICPTFSRGEDAKNKGVDKTMGRKHAVPYALLAMPWMVNGTVAKQCGVTEAHMSLYLASWTQAWAFAASDGRPSMTVECIYRFRHEVGGLYCEQPGVSINRIRFGREDGKSGTPANGFSDYEIKVDESHWAEGVELIRYLP